MARDQRQGEPVLITRKGTSLVLAAVALVAAGCGSSSSDKTSSSSGGATSTTPASKPTSAPADSGAGTTVTNEADEEGGLYFKKKQLHAKAGTVTVTVANPKTSGKPHGIAIEGNGVDKDGKVVAPGGKSTVTLKLKPGKYSFYCPVPGHEQAGMKGTLVVQ
jgi:uncharacterized cupredoxin-like copper-binding protein